VLVLCALVAWGAVTSGARQSGTPAEVLGWRLTEGGVVVVCPLTVGGRFEATTPAISGELGVDPTNPARLIGELAVDLSTMDTGIGLRNRHLRERYFEVEKGASFARALVSEVTLDAEAAATVTGSTTSTTFTAVLTLHGVTRPVAGHVDVRPEAGGVSIEARFPVRISDFEIPPPRYLGVGVKDEVQVRVTFVAVEGPRDDRP
jgi:polyisoprenoid-binding protein YceI